MADREHTKELLMRAAEECVARRRELRVHYASAWVAECSQITGRVLYDHRSPTLADALTRLLEDFNQ